MNLDPMQLADEARTGLTALIDLFGRDDAVYLATPDPQFAPKYDDYEHLARNIELAAEAVRQVIDSPSDKELVVAAWELIVATETLIGCAAHPDGSERPALKNLRQRALDAMSRAALQRRDKNG